MLTLLKIFIGIILLIFIVPLLWILINFVVLFFAWLLGAVGITGVALGDVFGWMIVIGLIGFIVWCICS